MWEYASHSHKDAKQGKWNYRIGLCFVRIYQDTKAQYQESRYHDEIVFCLLGA